MSNGEIIPGQEYDKTLNLVLEYSQQMLDVKTFKTIEGDDFIDGLPNDAGSVQTKDYNITQIQAALAGFYRVYVENTSIELPRVLLALSVVWDTSTAAGSYSESGAGTTSGSTVSLSLTAQGRAQGSAAVVPELVPIWYPLWTQDVPCVDYYFFLPANATRAQVLAQASVIASLWLGVSTTVLDWPRWAPEELNFSIAGQKVAASSEAVARCSVSINSSGDVSEASGSGSGFSYDKGHSIRPVNIPMSLHPEISLQSPTMSETVLAGAAATIAGGTNFPGQTAGATASATAFGNISPTSVVATSQTGYPHTGIYGKIDSEQYEYGYSAYRVRTIDFSIFPHNPQVTLIDFFGFTGAAFEEAGPGQAIVLTFNNNAAVIGIWFFISAETQPDLSAYGVTAYLQVTIGAGDSAATMAGKTQAAFAGSFSAVATATNVSGGGSNTAVKFVDSQNGPSNQPLFNSTSASAVTTQIGA